jgi:hypothetical protein
LMEREGRRRMAVPEHKNSRATDKIGGPGTTNSSLIQQESKNNLSVPTSEEHAD